MYENVQKEKEALVGKMAATETEFKAIREQLASSQESSAASAKVSKSHNQLVHRTYCYNGPMLLHRRVRSYSL